MIWRNNYVKETQDTMFKRKTRVTIPNEGDPGRPEGSNEPSRSKRRNLSMPSLMDTAPPPIFAEMQAMKEQMEVMLNALKGRVSSDLDDLVNKTDSPFTIPVNSCPLPQKF